MKKALFFLTALMLSVSLAGCGSSKTADTSVSDDTAVSDTADSTAATDKDSSESADENTSAGENTSADEEKTQDEINEELDNIAVDADESIDMSKVDGTEASEDTETESVDGEVGDTNVAIEGVTVISYEGSDVAVVSLKFKNKSGAETTFTGLNKITVSQNDSNLPTTAIIDVEGINCNTLMQPVANGETITVQQAFKLRDTESPITVNVDPATSITSGTVHKTFNLN